MRKKMIRDQKVGDRIYFEGEVRPYKIMACDERFLVCTKPFNPKRTVLYTIVDLDRAVRGTENLIFCMGFETATQCRWALKRIASGDTEISHRNRVDLRITRIDRC